MPDANKLVSECVSIFSCSKDSELSTFLAENAIMYEKMGRSRTYFIIDEEAVLLFCMLGYFSISIHAIKLLDSLTLH